jgi:hypothetical protein
MDISGHDHLEFFKAFVDKFSHVFITAPALPALPCISGERDVEIAQPWALFARLPRGRAAIRHLL